MSAFWKDGKVTICDLPLRHSDYIDWGRGRIEKCQSFQHLWSILLDLQDKQPIKPRGVEPDPELTDARGVMLGWKDDGTVRKPITALPVIGLDIDKGVLPEDIHVLAASVPSSAFLHDTKSSVAGARRYRGYVELSRVPEEDEVKHLLRHLNEKMGGVELQASNLNRVWSCMPFNARFALQDERPPLDVDAVMAFVPRTEKVERQRPEASEDLDQQAAQRAAEEALRAAQVDIGGLVAGDRHRRLCGIVAGFAKTLFGLIEAGFETDPEWWQDQVALAIDENITREKGDDPAATRRDVMRVLADMWKFGEEKPEEVSMAETLMGEDADEGVAAALEDDDMKPPPFPTSALPKKLRQTAEAMQMVVDAPPEICAHALLAATTAATQHLGNVKVDDWTTQIHNFFIALAPSGSRKTNVNKKAEAAFEAVSAMERDAYEDDYRVYHALNTVWQNKYKDTQKRFQDDPAEMARQIRDLGSPPIPPLMPERIIDDPTIPSLLDDLKYSHPSCIWIMDEAAKWLGGYSMKSENSGASAAVLNSLWNDMRQKPSRISGKPGKGEVPRFERPIIGRRVTLLWFSQPSISSNFVNDPHMIEAGLIARFLPVISDGSYRRTPGRQLENPEAYERASATVAWWQEELKRLLLIPGQCNPKVPNELQLDAIPLSASAAHLFNDEDKRIAEQQQNEDHPFNGIKEFNSKRLEHAIRLAGVFQFFENPHSEEVSLENFQRGVDISHYYAQVWLSIAKMPGEDDDGKLYEKVKKWLETSQFEQMSKAALAWCGPLRRRSAPLRHRIFDNLVTDGWLVELPQIERKRIRPKSPNVGSHKIIRPAKKTKKDA